MLIKLISDTIKYVIKLWKTIENYSLFSHSVLSNSPMNCSMRASLSFTISWSLLKPMSIESGDIQPVHPLLPSSLLALFPSCPQSFPASGCFPMSWLLVSGGQSIGASALASILSLNIQYWFPLGFTALILQFRGSQESSPISQFKSISSSELSLIYGPIFTSIHDYWKNHSFD